MTVFLPFYCTIAKQTTFKKSRTGPLAPMVIVKMTLTIIVYAVVLVAVTIKYVYGTHQ